MRGLELQLGYLITWAESNHASQSLGPNTGLLLLLLNIYITNFVITTL